MRAPSGQWFKAIADTRDAPWDGLSGPKSPVMPWIHPVLHPEIKSLIERWGVERTLAPKDPVLGTSERVDQLVMVKSGITARCVSSPFAQSRLSVAIGLPGRLACGNLNFFTGRPCVGRYFALVPSVVVSVPQELVMSLAKKNTEFLLLRRSLTAWALPQRPFSTLMSACSRFLCPGHPFTVSSPRLTAKPGWICRTFCAVKPSDTW